MGFVASAGVVILYECSIRPKLEMTVDDSFIAKGVNPSRTFYHVMVKNIPTFWPTVFIRRPAWSCQAKIEVLDSDGKTTLLEPILARWSSQPEPITTLSIGNSIIILPDVAKIIAGRKIDIHSHDPQMLCIAIKFDGSEDCYLFSNESYLHQNQNPSWKLGKGNYRLRVTLFYEQGNLPYDFEFQNWGPNWNDVNIKLLESP
jgi:hypothetical protein